MAPRVTVLFLVADAGERRARRRRSLPRSLASPGACRSRAKLDAIAYRIHAFRFPLWTFTIVAGAIWAEDAWGRYWGWDPKETWSFITLVAYAAYLHARATAGWKGRKARVIALVGVRLLRVQLLRREHPLQRPALLRRPAITDRHRPYPRGRSACARRTLPA